MPRSFFSPPRAASVAQSRMSLSAHSVQRTRKNAGAINFNVSYLKPTLRAASVGRYNPHKPKKNSVMSIQKRAEQTINAFTKRVIKYLIGNEKIQLEYTSSILDLKKYVNDPDNFWRNWYSFKDNFMSDVEMCKNEYERNKDHKSLKELCDNGFNTFSAELNQVHQSQKESFVKNYAKKFNEITSYCNHMRKIITKLVNNQNDNSISMRNLEDAITQLKVLRTSLPNEYDRFFSEPIVYGEENMTKIKVIQKVLAPIDGIISGIRTYINPSSVIQEAREEIAKEQLIIKKYVMFTETARHLQEKQLQKQVANKRIKHAKNKAVKKQKLESEIIQLKTEAKQLNTKLNKSNKAWDEVSVKMQELSNKLNDERRQMDKETINDCKILSAEQRFTHKKELEGKIAQLKEELERITDKNTIKKLEVENDQLMDEVKVVRKKFHKAQKSIIYQRELIKAKVDLFDDEQLKRPYIKNEKIVDKVNVISDDLKTTSYLLQSVRRMSEKRAGITQVIHKIPNPEKELPEKLEENTKSIEIIKELLQHQNKLVQELRRVQMESNMTYAIEELNAEKASEYEKTSEKLRNAIAKFNLPEDLRSLPLAAAEAFAKQAEIAKVQCQIDSIKGGEEGVKNLINLKAKSEDMIKIIDAKREALTVAMKMSKSSDASKKILDEAESAEFELDEMNDEIEKYSDAFSEIEQKLGIDSSELSLPERIRIVTNSLLE